MSVLGKQILINASAGESRVAFVDNGVLRELQMEREDDRRLVGNIYKGKVARVVPGMQAAFVDIGLSKNAFLHVRDIVIEQTSNSARIASSGSLPIEKLLHSGQFLQVQITREPRDDKGALLTTEISLASSNLVYAPGRNDIGVSRNIDDPSRRTELLGFVQAAQQKLSIEGGFVVRTKAQQAELSSIENDMQFLLMLWHKAQQASAKATAPQLLFEQPPLALRVLRDIDFSVAQKIIIDSLDYFERASDFAQEFVPALSEKLEHYKGVSLLFDEFNVEQQIEAALQASVVLKCGANIVIEQTEAMTTVDVNSAANLGQGSQDKAVLNSNLEAAKELAHQLRLRNIGGIVVVDFIDMKTSEQRHKVLEVLRLGLQDDPIKTTVSDFSSLGLVEITRKRSGVSLRDMICQTCSSCSGLGYVKTAQTMCYEILRELMRQNESFSAPNYLIVAAAEVVELLNGPKRCHLDKVQELVGRPIQLQVAPQSLPHQYEIVTS